MGGHGAIAPGRAGRHLHAALQHRPDRSDAGVLPRPPPRARRPDGRRARSSACSPRLFYLAELVLSPLFGILSDRYGHHRVMLYGPIFGGDRGGPDRVSTHEPAPGPRRDAHPRGRLERGERAVDPRLHRPRHRRQRGAAGQGRGALRGRDAGRARGRVRSSAPKLFEVVGPAAFFLNAAALRRVVPDLLVRRQGPGRRGGGASPASTSGSAATSSSSGRRTSGCSRRPGSRSTRRSGCGSASRSSSSRRATRASPTRR